MYVHVYLNTKRTSAQNLQQKSLQHTSSAHEAFLEMCQITGQINATTATRLLGYWFFGYVIKFQMVHIYIYQYVSSLLLRCNVLDIRLNCIKLNYKSKKNLMFATFFWALYCHVIVIISVFSGILFLFPSSLVRNEISYKSSSHQ